MLEFTLDYLKDEQRLLNASPIMPFIRCCDHTCERAYHVPTRCEVTVNGHWYCPDHITWPRLDKLNAEGYLGDEAEHLRFENSMLKQEIFRLRADLHEAEQNYHELARDYDNLNDEVWRDHECDDDEFQIAELERMD